MNFLRFFILCISMLIVGYGCSNASFDSSQRKVDKSDDSRDGLEGIGEVSGSIEIPDEYDSNNDGKADFLDDADGDGYPDGWVDTDGDGIPDDLPDNLKEIIGAASSTDGESPTISGSAKEDGLVEVNDCDLAKARGYLKTASKAVNYSSNSSKDYECDWDGGDGSSDAAKTHGVKAWKKNLDFGSDKVICSMKFKTPKQKFKYDDAILITMNEKALLWGTLKATEMPKVDGFRIYSWKAVFGNRLSSDYNGCVDGALECEVPKTDSTGSIKLALDDVMNKKLMKDVEMNGAELTLRAFGDNDKDIDCRHSGIDLEIEYQYFDK